MFDYDKSNFISFLQNFPNQIIESKQLMAGFKTEIDVSNIQNIVFSGMGGSAICSNLLLDYIQDELKLPAMVNREYSIPAFVNKHTLFISISYSGNTEETLSATNSAQQTGALVIGLSSGGELEKFCKDKNFPHIKIPGGLPPRQALGYLFFSLLFLFEKLEFISSKNHEVDETYNHLCKQAEVLSTNTNIRPNLSNHIAQTVYHTIPVIYTAVKHFSSVPIRWRNQFNENSKVMAFSNVFPEMNHNEIMGWEGPRKVNDVLRAIILRDLDESPQNQNRVNITKDILKRKQIPIMEIFAEGKSRLTRLFSLIYIGDWASYYLAMLMQADPIKIDSIDLLKERLTQSSN